MHHRDQILAPEEFAKRKEETRDKTESAAKEKRFLESEEKAEKEERDAVNMGLLEKLNIRSRGVERERNEDLDIQAPGSGPENAIAPEGTRDL